VALLILRGGEMNAQSVWPGHEYAYVSYVRKKHFPTGAVKVKVISVRKHQASYKDRTDTLATVLFDESKATREVNVRNLYDFWDSYMDEKAHVLEERQRRHEEQQKRNQEIRDRAEAERKNKRTIADNLAYKLGLDVAAVEVAHNGVVIGYQHLQFLLGDR
jgi:hypothetical protein